MQIDSPCVKVDVVVIVADPLPGMVRMGLAPERLVRCAPPGFKGVHAGWQGALPEPDATKSSGDMVAMEKTYGCGSKLNHQDMDGRL